MALIACPECDSKVSDQAKICVHCGYPLKRGVSTFKLILLEIPETNRWNEESAKKAIAKIDEVLRTVSDLDKKQIRSFIDNRPSVLLDGLSEEKADMLVKEFTEAGATVEKQESDSLLDGKLNALVEAYIRGDIICPKCHCMQIVWLPMGVEGYGGLFEHNICKKCGYNWAL